MALDMSFDLDQPFLIVSQHPVTEEFGAGEQQITNTMMAVMELGLPAIALWPNADAGAEDVARGLRKFRERHPDAPVHYFKNLPIHTYVRLMERTACLIGNSSSGIRDGAFIGTPAVNVGSRQRGRQKGRNTIDCGYEVSDVVAAVRDRLATGRLPSEPIYGDGTAGVQIANVLAEAPLTISKVMTY